MDLSSVNKGQWDVLVSSRNAPNQLSKDRIVYPDNQISFS